MGKRTANEKTVSQRLKSLRIEKGIRTQSELSKLSGVPFISIGRYERGETVPEDENLRKLALFFKVDRDYILGKSEYRTVFDKWNKSIDIEKLKAETDFLEVGIEYGLFPEISSEDEFQSFIEYLKQFEEKKEIIMRSVKADDIKIVNSPKNCISENFETGEITIYADSEDGLRKAYDLLKKHGISVIA